MIRFGVVGTGWIARSMINGARQYPRLLQLTAVYSRTEERGQAFADEVGATAVFTNLSAMAESEMVDMVYIASPNSCHVSQCRLFLEKGKHVLCEKPLAADPEDVRRLQLLAAARGLMFREAIMMLYQPSLERLRQAVAACGRISAAHFQFCQFSSKYDACRRGELPNIFNPAMHTGALMDLGVYCVYPALYLFGSPQTVSAVADFLPTGADGAGGALLHYPDKAVTLTYSKTGQGAAPSQIIGENGTVTVGHIGQLANICLHRRGEPVQEVYGSDDKATLMGREIAAFARLIEQPQSAEPWVDALTLEVSRWLYAIRQAAGIRFPHESQFDIEKKEQR